MINDNEFKSFIAELKAPWKTMGTDMDTALNIICKHSGNNQELDSIELISVSDGQPAPQLTFPDWQSEVEKAFIHQYGPADGRQIFKKVVMRIYQLSKGTASQMH